MVAFIRCHFRGCRAPLGLEVVEAAREVGVDSVEGGCPRLERLHDGGMFFFGHRKGQASAAVRAVSSTSAAARARVKLTSASWREIEPIRARRAGFMLSQTCVRHPKWAGGPRSPPREALGDTGVSRRRPWERSVPEPEMARSADEATGEDVS